MLNARLVCSIAGIRGVPIAAGSDSPIAGPESVAERPFSVGRAVHGPSGLGGIALDSPTVPQYDGSAVSLFREVLLAVSEPVTIVATGPLTNVATLIRDFPVLASRIREVVFMGGSTERGNVTPYGEFNVVADPEAVNLVLQSQVPLTFCGLNATHQVLVSAAIVQTIRAIGTPLANVCADLMVFFTDTYREIFEMNEPPLHDPVAVAHVIDPSIVECIRVPVAVELMGTYTRGATVIDLHHVTSTVSEAQVAMNVDVDAFWELLIDAIRILGLK